MAAVLKNGPIPGDVSWRRLSARSCTAIFSRTVAMSKDRTKHNAKGSDMQIQQTEKGNRLFRKAVLSDPEPSAWNRGYPAGVRLIASEIITAAVSGPEFVDGKQVFTFKTAVGTKA